MAANTKLTMKSKSNITIVTIILLAMSTALYFAVRMLCPPENIDSVNNIAIVFLLILSLYTRIYPLKNIIIFIDIYTIVFTTVISASFIDFDKHKTISIIMSALTLGLPLIFSYICFNESINNQVSSMVNFMNTYKIGGKTPDGSSAEYRKLHSAYNIMSDYIIKLENEVKNYNGDDNFTILNITNSKDERILKDRLNVLMRYFESKGFMVKLIPAKSGVSKIEISW